MSPTLGRILKIPNLHKILAAVSLVISQASVAEVTEIRLPTAEDGEIVYQFDTVTKKPLSAQDDRAEVMTVGLTFVPKNPGEPLRWAFTYEVRFKDGAIPKSVVVYSVNNKPISIEVKDISPILKNNAWGGLTTPRIVDEKTLKSMTGKDPWILQRKLVITYADGAERVLHQLAVITNPMRFELLEKVVGKSISTPSVAPKFDSRPWKVGFENGDDKQRITEFVLPNQTVETWRELFTRQDFVVSNNQVSFENLLTRIRNGHGSDCKSFQWDTLRETEMEAVYQWSHDGCKNSPAQFEIARLIRTEKGICRWAYASKETPVSSTSRELFKSVIENLKCE